MIQVILSTDGRDVGAAQGLVTIGAEQVEAAKVVAFAEWMRMTVCVLVGEEACRDDLAAVLYTSARDRQIESHIKIIVEGQVVVNR